MSALPWVSLWELIATQVKHPPLQFISNVDALWKLLIVSWGWKQKGQTGHSRAAGKTDSQPAGTGEGRVVRAPQGHAGTVPPTHTESMGSSTSWAQIPCKPVDAETPHENPEEQADPRSQAWKTQPTLPFPPRIGN